MPFRDKELGKWTAFTRLASRTWNDSCEFSLHEQTKTRNVIGPMKCAVITIDMIGQKFRA